MALITRMTAFLIREIRTEKNVSSMFLNKRKLYAYSTSSLEISTKFPIIYAYRYSRTNCLVRCLA